MGTPSVRAGAGAGDLTRLVARGVPPAFIGRLRSENRVADEDIHPHYP